MRFFKYFLLFLCVQIQAQTPRTFVFLGEGTGFYSIPSPTYLVEYSWQDAINQVPSLSFAMPSEAFPFGYLQDSASKPGEYTEVVSGAENVFLLYLPFSVSGGGDSDSNLRAESTLGPFSASILTGNSVFQSHLRFIMPSFGEWLSFVIDSGASVDDSLSWLSMYFKADGLIHLGLLSWLASVRFDTLVPPELQTGVFLREEYYAWSVNVGIDSSTHFPISLRGRLGNLSLWNFEVIGSMVLSYLSGFDGAELSFYQSPVSTFVYGLGVSYDSDKSFKIMSIQRLTIAGTLQHKIELKIGKSWSLMSHWKYFWETWGLGCGFYFEHYVKSNIFLEVAKQW